MAKINLKNGRIEDYTIVLSTRDYRHLGQLIGVKSENIQITNHLNSANELSFSINKYDLLKPVASNVLSDEEFDKYRLTQTILWNQIVDFRLVWIKETNEYYEIVVSIDDAEETSKTITGTSLCEAELGQLNIDSLEINSESDILRDDYVVTTFYNEKYPEASLLNRVLSDKAPHYTIDHVDSSLCNIQRTFSVSGTSIYDFLTGEVAEEFNCLFVFNSAKRSISVYDLYTTCLDCGYREDYYDVCPECGSTNLKYFGKDTTILVDKNNLTDSIHLEMGADNTKNCLKLVAGDDLMTATVRLLNQNGSDYLYYISEFQSKDMPENLRDKLSAYQKDYSSYTEEYQKAMSDYYNAIDETLYLQSSMMPTVEYVDSVDDITNPKRGAIYVCDDGKVYVYDGEKLVLQDKDADYYTNLVPSTDVITASSEADKLTENNLSPIAISSVTTATSVATVNSALKNYAKVYAKSGYVKIEIEDGASFKYLGEYTDTSTLGTYHHGTWIGRFIVTNYSDDTDKVTTDALSIEVNDNYQEFVKQKVLKQMALEDDTGSVFDVLAIEDINKFKDALTLYGLNRLTSFYDAIQGALDVLVQLNQGESDAELYNVLYNPYYEKLQACQAEIDKRQAEIDKSQERLNNANEIMTQIQAKLNLRSYLGEDLYSKYCAYRREDTYENSNYISDGLSNTELINKAKEFLAVANKELKRVAEPQYTITSTLKNLLVLDEFKPIVDYFELGNWIRVKIDGDIYKLRLIGYDISLGDLQDIGVEFSTITKIRDVAYEAQQITKASQSMSSNFSYVAQQAKQGNFAKSSVDNWIENGLNATNVQLRNNDNEEVVYGKTGILCRSYNDDTNDYSAEQLRLTHNLLVYTDDNWLTTKTALGKHKYVEYDTTTNTWKTVEDYGLTTRFVTSGQVMGSTIVGGMIYSTNYNNGYFGGTPDGSCIDLNNGEFSFGAGALTFKDGTLKISNTAFSEALENITATVENLSILAKNIDTTRGGITSDQIESVSLSQIEGTKNGLIQAEQINTITSEQITGDINAKTAEKADIANSATKADHATTADTANVANEVNADNISGTIESAKIAATLTDKTISGAFDGSVNSTSVTTVDTEGNKYNTISGEFTVGTMTLKFINGLLVSAETVDGTK